MGAESYIYIYIYILDTYIYYISFRYRNEAYSDDDMEADAREVLREEKRRYVIYQFNFIKVLFCKVSN